MARPLRIEFPGASYHITCRGIERRSIYADGTDQHKFLTLLSESLEFYQVILHAYVMMQNHFHLLIQTVKANCSEFMRHFNICYTGWFNWRHARCGNLYQGRYKAFIVDADNYLLTVSRYLHLNSVRVSGLKTLAHADKWRYARDYAWSSLPGYINERRVVPFVSYDLILSMVGGRRAYRDFVIDGLKRDMGSPFDKVKSRIILGDDDFVQEVTSHLKSGSRREQPAYRELTATAITPEMILGVLKRECGITEESLKKRGANGVVRGIVAELLYRYCEITQGQIGELLGGIDYISVHQLRRRMRQIMQDNDVVRRQYDGIEAKIKEVCTM